MALDSSILNATAHPPKPDIYGPNDWADYDTKQANLGAMAQQKQLRDQQIQENAMKLQAQQQVQEDQAKFADLYRQNSGDMDKALAAAPAAGINPAFISDATKANQAAKIQYAQMSEDQRKQQASHANRILGRLDVVLAAPTPEAAAAAYGQQIREGMAEGDIKPGEIPDTFPGIDALKNLRPVLLGHAAYIAEADKAAQEARAVTTAKREADTAKYSQLNTALDVAGKLSGFDSSSAPATTAATPVAPSQGAPPPVAVGNPAQASPVATQPPAATLPPSATAPVGLPAARPPIDADQPPREVADASAPPSIPVPLQARYASRRKAILDLIPESMRSTVESAIPGTYSAQNQKALDQIGMSEAARQTAADREKAEVDRKAAANQRAEPNTKDEVEIAAEDPRRTPAERQFYKAVADNMKKGSRAGSATEERLNRDAAINAAFNASDHDWSKVLDNVRAGKFSEFSSDIAEHAQKLSKLSTEVQRKVAAADSTVEQVQSAIKAIDDIKAAHPDWVGTANEHPINALSRNIKTKFGAEPADIGAADAILETVAAMQPGQHNFRSVGAMAEFKKALGIDAHTGKPDGSRAWLANPEKAKAALNSIVDFNERMKANTLKEAGQNPKRAAPEAPPLPSKLSSSDVDKVYTSPRTGKKMKIKAVNPKDPTQFKSEEVTE